MRRNSALLIVDLITDFNFVDGGKLFDSTKKILSGIASLKYKCETKGFPVLYVNDPAIEGLDSRQALIEKVYRSEKGRLLLDSVGPTQDDPIILKPHRSGFYKTDLESQLRTLDVEHLYIAGVTTDICVLFTANDAYMRKFDVTVPSDCVTAVELEHHQTALKFLSRVTEADTTPVIS